MQRVKDYRRRARVQHNASRPFNQLPAEIGCIIFASALAGEPSCARYYQHLYRLRLVCSQWRRVLDANPSFWALLSNLSSVSAWSAILQRSQTAPLRMDFDDWEDRSYLPAPSRTDFLNTASSQMHRIKSLSFRSRLNADPLIPLEECQALKSIIESSAPLLELLHIRFGNKDPAIKIEVSGKMPRLRDVSGWPVAVLSSALLANLQALSIYYPLALSLKRFRDVLSATKNLIHLRIGGGLDERVPSIFATQPTTLPSLKTVNIGYITPQHLSSVLTFFRAPSADYIALASHDSMEHPPHLGEHLAQHITSFIEAQSPGTILRVRCWHTSVTINDRLFYLKGGDEDYPYDMRQTLTYLSPVKSPVHLSIEKELDYFEPDELLIALDYAFPNTFELALPSYSHLSRRLLGRPQWRDLPRWIFPNIKRMKFNGPELSTKRLRRAVKIAKARKEAGIALDSIHVMGHTPYRTRCYRKVLREANDIVAIKCDAASELLVEPRQLMFTRFDDPPPAGGSWFTVNEPFVEVPEPQEYRVSTSDEQEPWTPGSSEDETGSEGGGHQDEDEEVEVTGVVHHW